MKSSSSSFSISSSSSFSGCFSGILRRFLCSVGLSSYPSDQFSETNSKFCDLRQQSESENAEQLGGKGSGPGVVAKLMGLDSMPETDPGNTGILRESITRSRSMNSVDCFWKESDRLEGRHRRVKSTLGLGQIPDFVELEDENFFILSFEHKGGEIRDFGWREGKSGKNFEELRQHKMGKGKNRRRTEKDRGGVKQRKTVELEKLVMQRDTEDKESHKTALNAAEENHQASKREKFGCHRLEDSVESYCPFIDEDLILVEAKSRMRRREEETKCTLGYNEEHECASHEDSSPVSVLDFDRSLAVREPPESGY